MENNQAKITISLTEGKFEISGSELFVTQQIENFKSLIEQTLTEVENNTTPSTKSSTKNESPKSSEIPKSKSEGSIADLHPTIYAIDNEQINIICDIPGSTDSKKALNVALLFSYGQKSQGIGESSVEDIRAICKMHGCFDQTNFSSHIKNGNPKLYLDKGSGKSRTITITRPGENQVKDLIKSIESNE